MALIEVENLGKEYRGLVALDGFSCSLEGGQIVGLLGENGSGKTTFLKILSNILSDYTGKVTIAGKCPGVETKRLVSFLPDASFLQESRTTAYAVEMYQDFFADFDRSKALDMLGYFRIDPNRVLKTLSKGTREKVQISLAMSRNAKVYLLDEPISGVDPAAREVILGGILRNFADDALLLFSTHLIADVENVIDSVLFVKDGKVMLSGGADDLRSEHGTSIDKLFREVYACSAF